MLKELDIKIKVEFVKSMELVQMSLIFNSCRFWDFALDKNVEEMQKMLF